MQRTRNDSGELNFYLLKCLVALVEHSHVSRAAEALSISQPAMSRAMSQLRRVTDDPILVKTGGRFVPTTKAAQLRDAAERILEQLSEMLGSAVAFEPQTTRYVFRMVATDFLECLVMDRVVEHLGTRFPGIAMSVQHPVHPSQFNKVLEAGEVDFCIGQLPPSLRELRHRLLFRDQVVCAARSGHPAGGRILTMPEFAALEHVVITPNTMNRFGEAVDEVLGAQGLQRNRRFVTPNYLTAPHLLERSDMVALLPLSLVNRFRDRFGLVELALPMETPTFEVYISWHERTHRHAAHIWFRDQVMQSLFRRAGTAQSLGDARSE